MSIKAAYVSLMALSLTICIESFDIAQTYFPVSDVEYRHKDPEKPRIGRFEDNSIAHSSRQQQVQPQTTMSPLRMLEMAIPGTPGVDYPILASVPKTAFTCEGLQFGGYYADVEAGCQVFHVCGPGSAPGWSFLCPNGTIFSEETFTCQWWFNVACY